MARYYPKHQEQTNLYTNGNEFKISGDLNSKQNEFKTSGDLNSKQEYSGFYYVTSDGTAFTGRDPNDSSILLSPISSTTPTPSIDSSPLSPQVIKRANSDSISYYKVNERYIPIPTKTSPKRINYINRTFERYFCKKNNEISYFEIDKKTYNDLINKSMKVAYELYTPILVSWNLQDNQKLMFESNKALILQKSQQLKLPGFFSFFKNNFSEFYSEINLTTTSSFVENVPIIPSSTSQDVEESGY